MLKLSYYFLTWNVNPRTSDHLCPLHTELSIGPPCQNSSKSYCCDPSLWISQCSVCTSWGTWHILSHMKSYYFIYLSNLLYYSKIISYSNLYSLADKEQVFYVPYTKMEEYTIENKYLCNWTKERTEAQGTASQVRISQILTYKYV